MNSSTRCAIALEIPAAIARVLGDAPEKVAREILELAAAESYRSQKLSRGQVAELLDLSWAETEEFLAAHRCHRHYDLEDLEEDRRNLDRILGPA